MTKKGINVKLSEFGIYNKEYSSISSIKNKELDENYINSDDNGKYIINDNDLSHEDVMIALQIRILEKTNSIKNMVKFFVILTISSIVLTFLYWLGTLA